jgi:hypothetical protein
VLFGISLLASLASTTLFMGYRLPVEAWRIVFILALVTLTINRTILIPGVLLPNVTSPHLEFLADDLQDEWRELQQRTISHPHILIVSASILALVYVWCIFYYGILTNAMWFGWMPVGVAAIGMDLLLTTSVGGRSGIDFPRMGAQHSGAADAHRVVRAPRHPT